MEVVYWRSQRLGDEQIQRLCGLSKATFYRYLGAYQGGGVAKFKELSGHPRGSAFVGSRDPGDYDHQRILRGRLLSQ
jgi:hypothetical protein